MSIGKSKNNLGKPTMDKIRHRMAVLGQLTGKSGNKLGLEAGLGNATVNDWSDNQVEKPTRTVEDFLEYHSISETWWKTGEGEVFITLEQKPDDNKEKMHNHNDIYRTIVEGHTEYLLVPREVLKETQLVSTEQIKRTWEELAEKNKELERKNKQIDFYQTEISKLLSNLELAPKSTNPEKSKE